VPPHSKAFRGAVRHHLDFPSPLKAYLHHRKAPAASGVRGLPERAQPPLPDLLALGASGERGHALGRWSGRRSGGCGGASAGRHPLRAARTPTCCAMGPSPPTSLHEPAATRPTEASGLRPRPWRCHILRGHVPERPTRYWSQFSIILAVGSSLPRREQARHSFRQLHHLLQRRSLLWG
jgi:hypothetical protein